MIYRALSRTQVEEFVAALNSARGQKARAAVSAPHPSQRGSGQDSEELVKRMSNAVLKGLPALSRTIDADVLEGELSVQVHRDLAGLDPEVLNDLDFWRYVACVHLRDFIIWRDGNPDLPASRSGFGAGKSASGFQDCVPYRMFRRGQIANMAKVPGVTPLQIAKIAGTDLWRSHVLRVRIGTAPTAAAAFLRVADGYRGGALSLTKLTREAAKLVKRLRSNVLMDYLDYEDARVIIEAEFKTAVDIVSDGHAQVDAQADMRKVRVKVRKSAKKSVDPKVRK